MKWRNKNNEKQSVLNIGRRVKEEFFFAFREQPINKVELKQCPFNESRAQPSPACDLPIY